MIEARDPLANENATTPINIMKMQNIFSAGVFILISPYPTVVIVVTVKYIAMRYKFYVSISI